MGGLMTREEHREFTISLTAPVARKYNMAPLSDAEIEELYEMYVRGNGSLFAVVEEERH